MSSSDAARPSMLVTPLLVAGAVFVAAGGWIHLDLLLNTYDNLPDNAPGVEVITVGFPLNVAASVAIAVALLAAIRVERLRLPAVAAGLGFQVASLAVLIQSRTGSVLGWREPVWSDGANQTRAVEIGAIVCLAAAGALLALRRRSDPAS